MRTFQALRGGCRIGAVAAVLFAAVPPAAAQNTPPSPKSPAAAPATSPAPPPAAPASKKPVPPVVGTPAVVVDNNQIESVLGKSVQGPKGDDMGRIVDVLIDRSGDVRAAVIDFGGFFGVGSRKIAVDWDELHFKKDAKADAIVTDIPAEDLRTAPVYKDGEPVVIVGGKRPAAPAAPSPPPAAGAASPSAAPPAPEPAAPK